MSDACPTDSDLVPLLAGETVTTETHTHVKTCTHCRDRLSRMKKDLDMLRTTVTVPGATTPGAPASPAPPRPSAIGKYPIVGVLDSGGQAIVYRSLHPTLDKELVIKCSRKPVGDDPAERHLLVAEGKLLARVEHPNLARVYDLDFHEGHPFLALEYIRGRNLRQYAKEFKVRPRQAARWVADVARALAAVHRHGIIHQDIKPHNILIDEEDRPRLIDFGIARMRHVWADPADQPSGGTPSFMAPEQARGEAAPRSDLFALGGVLYFLLTGKAPFVGASIRETLHNVLHCRFDRAALEGPGIPRRLKAICLRAMAEKTADRHGSADELADDLEGYLRSGQWLRRLAAVAALLIFAAWFAWALYPWHRPPPTPPPTGPSEIQVTIFRQDRPLDLDAAVPLRADEDKLRVSCKLPRGFSWVMFHLSTDGIVKRLDPEVSEGDDFVKLVFPGQGQRVGFEKGAASEFILVCASPSAETLPKDLEAILAELAPLPQLPPPVVVWLNRDEVTLGGEGERGFTRAEKDPVGEIESRLDRLRLRLRDRCKIIQGVAFSH